MEKSNGQKRQTSKHRRRRDEGGGRAGAASESSQLRHDNIFINSDSRNVESEKYSPQVFRCLRTLSSIPALEGDVAAWAAFARVGT